MRVIAGKVKGKALLCQEGEGTRPSTDYFRELLFDCLQFQVEGTSWLDLFSGTGAIAIEALSRGALDAVLVENDPKAATIIWQNLQNTGFGNCAKIERTDVLSALSCLITKNRQFDYIFMDPPYNQGWEDKLLSTIPGSLLKPQGKLIIESDAKTVFSQEALGGWEIYKEKTTRRTKMTFLRRRENG